MSDYDFEVVKNAGLTHNEFAQLIGTTRVSANQWINGKVKPNIYFEPKVKATLTLLRHAVEVKALPSSNLPTSRADGKTARFRAIRQILHDVMMDLRARRRPQQDT